MLSRETLQKAEGPGELRLSWDNAAVRKDSFLSWFLPLFWLAWPPIAAYSTWRIFTSDSPYFFSTWAFFGWGGTLGIFYILMQRSWTETVVVSSEGITLIRRGFLAGKPIIIPTSQISQIGIGRYAERKPESNITLNIHHSPIKNKLMRTRQMVGYWLHDELKEQIFSHLQDFAAKHGLPWQFTRY